MVYWLVIIGVGIAGAVVGAIATAVYITKGMFR